MKDKIKVLIADDHTIVRIGLATLLNTEKDIEVVGEAKNGDMAVREALRVNPDVIIMDLMMPIKDGATATAEISEKLPTAKGRIWYECDIDYAGQKSRNAKRILYSNDGLIYYTEDHYQTFERLY